MEKSKIFFDGQCIVCDFEIAHYKRIAPDRFDIVDISHPQFDAKQFGLTSEALQLNMHVLTEGGELKIGVDAFAHIWSRIDGYRWASRVVKWPGVYSAAKVGYFCFARMRRFLPRKSKK